MKAVYALNGQPTKRVDVRAGWNLTEGSLGIHIWPAAVLLSNAARAAIRGQVQLKFYRLEMDDGSTLEILRERPGGKLHAIPVRTGIVRRRTGYTPRPRLRPPPWLVPRPRAKWTQVAEGWLAQCISALISNTANPNLWHFTPPLGGEWFPYGPPDKDTPGGRGLNFSPGFEDSYGWLAWQCDRMIERCPLLNLDPATGEPLTLAQTPLDGYYSLERGEPWNPGTPSKVAALPDWFEPLVPSDPYNSRRRARIWIAGDCDYLTDLVRYQGPNGQHLGRLTQLLKALKVLYGDDLADFMLRATAADCSYAYPLNKIKAIASGPAGQGSSGVAREFGWVSCAFEAAGREFDELKSAMRRAMGRVLLDACGLTQSWPGTNAENSGFTPFPWGDSGNKLGFDWSASQSMEAAIVCEGASPPVREAMFARFFGNMGAFRINGQLPHFVGVARNGVPVPASDLKPQGDTESTFCWSQLGNGRLFDVMQETFLPGTATRVPRAQLVEALVAHAGTENLRALEQTGPAIAALEAA